MHYCVDTFKPTFVLVYSIDYQETCLVVSVSNESLKIHIICIALGKKTDVGCQRKLCFERFFFLSRLNE